MREEADRQTAERRNRIISEAADALSQTKEALTALEQENPDEALEALAIATGKLELIVAREPKLALAPTDVTVTTRDLYATPEAIGDAIDRADDALDDGDIQRVRRILEGMASEIVITVENLPLATYPDAIKAITPLIDKGEIEKAKTKLQAALNTMVLTDHIIPLPVLRSESLLEKAESLAEKTGRSEEESAQLADLMTSARTQLEIAELLGYGDEADYDALYAQLDEIEAKTGAGKSGRGLFDDIQESFSNLWSSMS